MNERQQRGQFYLTGDHNLAKKNNTGIHVKVHGPTRAALAAQTKVTKYQRVKVTDRRRICFRHDPIVARQKSSDGPG